MKILKIDKDSVQIESKKKDSVLSDNELEKIAQEGMERWLKECREYDIKFKCE